MRPRCGSKRYARRGDRTPRAARRHGRVLRVDRAARSPRAARQAGDRRRHLAARRGGRGLATRRARFGVRSAMPGFRARELCPDGVFLPSDMRKYGAVSTQVHACSSEFTPLIEPLALDEAFLDITGSVRCLAAPLALAQRLKDARARGDTARGVVRRRAQQAGGQDRVRARQTRRTAHACASAEMRALLDPLPMRRLWGVGPVTEQALRGARHRHDRAIGARRRSALRALVGDRAPRA